MLLQFQQHKPECSTFTLVLLVFFVCLFLGGREEGKEFKCKHTPYWYNSKRVGSNGFPIVDSANCYNQNL